jgi:hypothetical protein
VIATACLFLAVTVVGACSGLIASAWLLRLRFPRIYTVQVDEADDDRLEAMAREWAEDTGREWAAASIADKMRLLSRLERARRLRGRR